MKQNSHQTATEEMDEEIVPEFGYEHFRPSPIKADVAPSLKRIEASVMDLTRSVSNAAKSVHKNARQSNIKSRETPGSPEIAKYTSEFTASSECDLNQETVSKQRRRQSPETSQEMKRRQLNNFSRRPVIEKMSEFVTGTSPAGVGTESTARTNTDSVAPIKKATVQKISYPESNSVPNKMRLPIPPGLPSNQTFKGFLSPYQIEQKVKHLSDGSTAATNKTLAKNIAKGPINFNPLDFLDKRSNRMTLLAPTKRGDKSCSKVSAVKIQPRNNVRVQISQFYDPKKETVVYALHSPSEPVQPSLREERLPNIEQRQLHFTSIPNTCLKMIKDMGDYAGIARKLKRSVEDINNRPIRLI